MCFIPLQTSYIPKFSLSFNLWWFKYVACCLVENTNIRRHAYAHTHDTIYILYSEWFWNEKIRRIKSGFLPYHMCFVSPFLPLTFINLSFSAMYRILCASVKRYALKGVFQTYPRCYLFDRIMVYLLKIFHRVSNIKIGSKPWRVSTNFFYR